MPSKSKKDKSKGKNLCWVCNKLILEQLGAWIHADTGKSESNTPVYHAAYPKSHKKSK
jgi:hypothetical protein